MNSLPFPLLPLPSPLPLSPSACMQRVFLSAQRKLHIFIFAPYQKPFAACPLSLSPLSPASSAFLTSLPSPYLPSPSLPRLPKIPHDFKHLFLSQLSHHFPLVFLLQFASTRCTSVACNMHLPAASTPMSNRRNQRAALISCTTGWRAIATDAAASAASASRLTTASRDSPVAGAT